jgi:hypothetical protein
MTPDEVKARLLACRVIDAAGCWNWTGGRAGSGGYGQIRIDGKKTYVHRAAFEAWRHPLAPGFNSLHRCDNPRCFNPEHLFEGTQDDNVKDCVEKGRHRTGERPRGAKHGNATITEADVLTIRVRCAAGESQSVLAREFKQTQGNISKIVLYHAWKHVQ